MKRAFLVLMCGMVVVLGKSGQAAKNLAAFTEDFISRYNLADDDLKKVQFYVSGDVILQRTLAQGESATVKGHTLRFFSNRRVEEVTFRAKTPGVVEMVREHGMFVSFETGASLDFCTAANGRGGRGGFVPPDGSFYKLCASRWEGNTGYLTYAGRQFTAIGTSSSVYLQVDLKQMDKFEKKARVVRGRKV